MHEAGMVMTLRRLLGQGLDQEAHQDQDQDLDHLHSDQVQDNVHTAHSTHHVHAADGEEHTGYDYDSYPHSSNLLSKGEVGAIRAMPDGLQHGGMERHGPSNNDVSKQQTASLPQTQQQVSARPKQPHPPLQLPTTMSGRLSSDSSSNCREDAALKNEPSLHKASQSRVLDEASADGTAQDLRYAGLPPSHTSQLSDWLEAGGRIVMAGPNYSQWLGWLASTEAAESQEEPGTSAGSSAADNDQGPQADADNASGHSNYLQQSLHLGLLQRRSQAQSAESHNSGRPSNAELDDQQQIQMSPGMSLNQRSNADCSKVWCLELIWPELAELGWPDQVPYVCGVPSSTEQQPMPCSPCGSSAGTQWTSRTTNANGPPGHSKHADGFQEHGRLDPPRYVPSLQELVLQSGYVSSICVFKA